MRVGPAVEEGLVDGVGLGVAVGDGAGREVGEGWGRFKLIAREVVAGVAEQAEAVRRWALT